MADQFTDSHDNTDTVTGLTLDSTGTNLYMGVSTLMSEGKILSFAVNSTGHMSSLGVGTQTEEIPGRLVITADGRTVYDAMVRRRMTADSGGYDLLTRDPATGMLTDQGRFFISPDPCCEFFLDSALALGGQFLLGVSPNQQIVVYSVDSGTGDLTIASVLNGDFEGLTVDNTGKFAIVTHASGAVGSYQINPNGTLTFIGSLSAAAGVNNVVMDPSNQFVYVENSSAPQIFAFTFNASNGALGNMAGSPFTTSGVPVRMAAVGR
jgi:6-phosphogluconolactonase (cycloisomerase 2 family)